MSTERVSTAVRNAVSNGEVTGARRAELTDLRWKRERVFRGNKLVQEKTKILFNTLLLKYVTRNDIVTCAGKVRFTFHGT